MSSVIKNIALVSAAGSGKTHALTKRFLLLFLQDPGYPLESLYAITFTNAAAYEMKDRILHYLDVLSTGNAETDSEKEVLEYFEGIFPDVSKRAAARRMQLLNNLSDLHISTFHSLFASFLSCIPFAADIMPDYDILDEMRESALLVQTIDEFFEAAGSDRKVMRVLSDMMEQQGKGIRRDFDTLYANLISWMDFFDELIGREQKIAEDTTLHAGAFAGSLKKFTAFVRAHEDAARTKSTGRMNANLAKLLDKIEEAAAAGDADALRPFFSEFLEKGIDGKKYIRDFIENLDSPQEYHAVLNELLVACRNYVVTLSEREILVHVKPIMKIHEYFQRAKKEKNALSFSDIEKFTLKALRASPETEYLYFKLGSDINHLMIDEFQDTSFHQIEILEPIMDEITAVEPKKKSLFYVGDPHQSVFRWRGGAPELFEYVKQRYEEKIEGDELIVNYRTKQEIIDFVNLVLDKKDQAKPGNAGGWVRVEEIGSYDLKGEAREAVMEKTVAIIEELTGKHGYALDDIAVLTRKNKFARDLAGVLSASDIACVSQARASVLDEHDVQFMLHLLGFLDDPQDDFSLVHVLLSPVVNLKEETIRKLKFHGKTLYMILSDHHADWPATKKLKNLLSNVYFCNPYELIFRSMREFGLEMSYPLATMLDAALTYTKDGLNSLAPFITWFEQQGALLQVKETHARGVQILTIHRAKGLEFEVVIIPETDIDLSRGENDNLIFSYKDDSVRPDKVFWRGYGKYLLDLKEAERARLAKDSLNLLYVALTRAKTGVCMLGFTIKNKNAGFWFETTKERLGGKPYPMHDIVPKEKPREGEAKTEPYVEVREAPVISEERTLYSPTERGVEIVAPERRRGMKFGEMIHRALSQVEWLDEVDVEKCIAGVVEYTKSIFARSAEDEKEIDARLAPLLRDTLSDPDLRFLFYKNDRDMTCKNELPIYFEEEKRDVSAHIDRLIVGSDEVIIADYKTGGEKEEYKKQLRVYKKGIEKIYPGRRIRTLMVYLEKEKGNKITEV
jgi:ATP-dependent exoDNAse (exonuclease V) beta subunit